MESDTIVSNNSDSDSTSTLDSRRILRRLKKLEKRVNRAKERKRRHVRRDHSDSEDEGRGDRSNRSRSRHKKRRHHVSRSRSSSRGSAGFEGLQQNDIEQEEANAHSATDPSTEPNRDLPDVSATATGDHLPPEILSLLGETNTEQDADNSIHTDLAVRWEKIIKKGLEPVIKSQLIGKYPPISNCVAMCPPKINPEVKNAITEAALRRDERLVDKQKQISACLSAMGKICTHFLNRNEENEDHSLLETVSDAARLLADLFFNESQSRKILVGSGLNNKFKVALEDAPTDDFLFGSDLTERIKNAKSLERSALDLKRVTPNVKPQNSLNFKRPSTLKYPQRSIPKIDGRSHWNQRNARAPLARQVSQNQLESKNQRYHRQLPYQRRHK